ncbi:MAG: hypothetical protein A2804_01390 [Candidatus Pacebacteria bacterium RIFCSPHIGHO2_01_FULL_46_10]|nr:MAG: hypothetical protein A2804_01390 [Candidatus Pacebacteria bacterium RIFCSPHIGHO2_01_FULL_46_10]
MNFTQTESQTPAPEKSLELLVGTHVVINPQQLINRKLLFTTQEDIDLKKLSNALEQRVDPPDIDPQVWISYEFIHRKWQLVYIVGEGNHRISLAAINRTPITVYVRDVWSFGREKRRGFNSMTSQVLAETIEK